jgi:hypothetical protein
MRQISISDVIMVSYIPQLFIVVIFWYVLPVYKNLLYTICMLLDEYLLQNI